MLPPAMPDIAIYRLTFDGASQVGSCNAHGVDVHCLFEAIVFRRDHLSRRLTATYYAPAVCAAPVIADRARLALSLPCRAALA